jgi:hypothetical protein
VLPAAADMLAPTPMLLLLLLLLLLPDLLDVLRGDF